MTELAAFAAVLNSLKVAADIAKTLKDSDLSIERAEMKMKIAELIGAVADAKISALELQSKLQEKDQEIARLKDALTLSAEVVKDGDAYFRKSAGGRASGEPLCVRCWEDEKRLRHLVRAPDDSSQMMCPGCKTRYSWYDMPHPDEERG